MFSKDLFFWRKIRFFGKPVRETYFGVQEAFFGDRTGCVRAVRNRPGPFSNSATFLGVQGVSSGLSGGYLAATNLSQQNLVWVSFVGVNNQKGPNPHTFNYIYPVRIETPPNFMCMPMCFGNVGMEKLAYEIAPRAGCFFELVFWVVLEFTNIHILWNHIPSLKTFCKICKPPRIERDWNLWIPQSLLTIKALE